MNTQVKENKGLLKKLSKLFPKRLVLSQKQENERFKYVNCSKDELVYALQIAYAKC